MVAKLSLAGKEPFPDSAWEREESDFVTLGAAKGASILKT